MSFCTPETRHYSVELLTERYFLAGTLELPGMLLNYLNHPERATLLFKQVTVSAFEAGSRLAAWQAEQLFVRREEILAIRFLETLSPTTMQLLPRQEKLRVIFPRFIVQGVFRCGVDTGLGDLFDTMTSYWAPATEVLVHPLLPSAVSVFSSVPLLLVNRRRLLFYQPVKD